MTSRFSRFSPKALAFLRALKRHNDREWFKARKEEYEVLLRAPMIALIDRLAADESPSFRRGVGPLWGDQLQRVPRGFPKDHEAAIYLKFRQFLAGREFPASLATSTRFYPAVLNVFRQVAPLVRFLNEPLVGERRGPG